MTNALVKQTERQLSALGNDRFRMALKRIAADRLDLDRFVEVVGLNLKTNPRLAQCTTESLLFACMDAARRGLEPTGLTGGGWLIHRKKSRKVDGQWENWLEAEFMASYYGDLKQVRRTVETDRVVAEVVYSADEFHYEPTNLDHPITHKPNLFAEDRGHIIAAYCVLRLKGGEMYGAVINGADVARAKETAYVDKDSPWTKHEGEMWKKTALKRATKYAPRDEAVFDDDDDVTLRARDLEIETEAREIAAMANARADAVEAAGQDQEPLDVEAFAVPPEGPDGATTPKVTKAALFKMCQDMRISRGERDGVLAQTFGDRGYDDLGADELDQLRVELESYEANRGQ